jgi:hypothetical protein
MQNPCCSAFSSLAGSLAPSGSMKGTKVANRALRSSMRRSIGSARAGSRTSSGQSSTSRPLSRVLIGSPSRRFEVLEPSVVAHSLMAAHRVLVELVRSLAVGGVAPEEIAARAARRADSAFAVISDGIAGYGRR